MTSEAELAALGRAVESLEDGTVSFLREMVRTPSVNPPGDYAAILDLLRTRYGEYGWDVGIALDCHGRFTRRGAIEVADALAEYDIMFLEEPVELENREVMADVTQHVDMPVATGERIYNNETMEDVVRKQACDIIQPDVTKYGSLQEVQHAVSMGPSHAT